MPAVRRNWRRFKAETECENVFCGMESNYQSLPAMAMKSTAWLEKKRRLSARLSKARSPCQRKRW
jgi:hypothetical protein